MRGKGIEVEKRGHRTGGRKGREGKTEEGRARGQE